MHSLHDIQAHDPELDAFLIPGTDADVARRYHALAQQAAEGGLSLFEKPVVICDTETTGLDAAHCSLIEIAAVRLEGAEISGEFTTFVNPGRPIPAEIVELTGISDADVADAPSPRESVAQFARFAGDADLIAHNASFDRSFVMRQAAPGTLGGPWVDTLALSQIVLPRLRSHRLADLSRAFGLCPPAHRALDDVLALAGIWRILLSGLRSMDPGLAAHIAALSPETPWALRPLFEEAAGAAPGARFTLRQARTSRVGQQSDTQRYDAEEIPLEFACDEVIAQAFSAEGTAGKMYPGYETRAEQVEMAREVQDALRDGSYRVLEAGTGVGKSVAYLVPLALAARDNIITVGVATKTNALMDQLVYHELPRLADAIGGLDYVALKGYEHYPCLRKFDQMMRAAVDEDVGVVQMMAMLASYVAETSWGDLDALNLHWYGLPRMKVQASSNDCLKNRCPFYPRRCYLHGARRRAASADIVVTNHALLFRDIQAENAILPPIRHWVVDEAHAAEDEARRQLSCAFSARELETVLLRLSSTRSGIIASIRKKASSLEGGNLLYGITLDIEQRVERIVALETSFFSYVKELADESAEKNSGYDRLTLWVGPELRNSGAWARLEGPGSSLVDKLDGLVAHLSNLVSTVEQYEGIFASQQADLSTLGCNLREMQHALELVLDGSDTSYVYSVELDRDPEKVAETLLASKLDIGEVLVGDFYPRTMSVVYTSATLATGDKKAPFGHFCRVMGLDRVAEGRVTCRQLASSYDFEHHMSILLPDDIPEPAQRGYRDALVDLLYQVHVAMGGSVLTLFTNRREMEELYRRLRPVLHEAGIELIAQVRGTSVKTLHDRFLSEGELSLFALKSFWEGFDAPGDTLRCVVIPKLPFSRPNDPLSREREAREGRAAWSRYALPEAVVDLKQAAGRLIRKSDDAGWLVLADARLQTKNYGSTFLRAMPTTDIRTMSTAEIGTLLKHGRPGRERPATRP